MRYNRIVCLIMALAIVSLSIGNSVTDYGIKGSQNLKFVVLATVGSGSSGHSSGSSSSTGTSSGEESQPYKVTPELVSEEEGLPYDSVPPPGQKCTNTKKVERITCPPGYTNCIPGMATTNSTRCFVPD